MPQHTTLDEGLTLLRPGWSAASTGGFPQIGQQTSGRDRVRRRIAVLPGDRPARKAFQHTPTHSERDDGDHDMRGLRDDDWGTRTPSCGVIRGSSVSMQTKDPRPLLLIRPESTSR